MVVIILVRLATSLWLSYLTPMNSLRLLSKIHQLVAVIAELSVNYRIVLRLTSLDVESHTLDWSSKMTSGSDRPIAV